VRSSSWCVVAAGRGGRHHRRMCRRGFVPRMVGEAPPGGPRRMDTFGDPPGRRATVTNVSERLQDVMAALVPVSEPREPEDFIAAIAVAHAIEEQSRELLQSSVLAARESGATWVDIGKSLGVSKQAAQKRFAAPVKLSARSLDRKSTRLNSSHVSISY